MGTIWEGRGPPDNIILYENMMMLSGGPIGRFNVVLVVGGFD